jgi:NADH-quinone oxidoreductase subunit B
LDNERETNAGSSRFRLRKILGNIIKRKPVSSIRNWAISFSLWPVHFTTACCGTEFAAAFCPRYDAERFGVLPFVGTRQCNMIFIEGTLTRKMAEAAKIVYAQMPEPKFVVVMGACAIEGGIFWNSYNIVKPKDILPVDVFIIGCPPRPEGVLRGLNMVQEKIRKKGVPYPET